MDSEAHMETTSFLTKQPSGIRALPSSHDDDSDTDLVFETNNSPQKIILNEENNKNSTSSGSNNNSSNGSSKSSNSSSSSFGTGGEGDNNEGFMSGEEDFETPMAGPDEETLENSMAFGQNDVPGVGPLKGLSGFSGKKGTVPIAKVSGDEDDDDENEVVGGNVDEGQVGNDEMGMVYAVKNAPKVKVLDEEDVAGENANEAVEELKVESRNLGDEGTQNEPKVESLEEEDSLGSKSEENAGGVESTSEGDAVVSSIHVDVGEAVRSGAAIVGEQKEEDSEGKSAGETSVVEEFSEVDSKTVDTDGMNSTNEGGSLEDPKIVDANETVKPAADVAGEVNEGKDSEVESGNEQTSVVEGSASKDSLAEVDKAKFKDEGDSIVNSIAVDVGEAVMSGAAIVGEPPVAEESAPVDSKAIETVEADTIVDEILVDAVEAARSGVTIVGDSGAERMELEVSKVAPPVAENVTLGNEFEPLTGSNAFEVADVSGVQNDEPLANEAEKHQSTEIMAQLDTEESKLETDFKSEQHELAHGVEVVSGGDEKKVEPDNVDNEPRAKSAVVGGEAKSEGSYVTALLSGLDPVASDKTHQREIVEQTEPVGPEIGEEAEEGGKLEHQEDGDIGGSGTDEESDQVVFDGSSGRQFMEALGLASGAISSRDHSEAIDGQVVTESEEEADSDEEGEGKELFDSAALAALLKAATSAGSDSGSITITSQDGSRLFSVERPAGLGPSLRAVRSATRPSNSGVFNTTSLSAPTEENLSEEEKKKLEKIQQLRVKFMRLVHRLGHTAEDSLAAQVLYRLALLAGRPANPAFSFDNAKQTAMQLEAERPDDLEFSLNILVLGKTGVGKSATINSIFGEEKVKINAFEPETTSVSEVSGIVDGVKIRVIDAPGLRPSGIEQGFNRKVLSSVKKLTKKYPPDVMLYVDRLDSQTRDLNDLLMLRTVTSSLGSSIWRSAIVTLTHGACAPPDGPSGSPLSYEVFVAQRSHIAQQSIGQAVGDLRVMNPNLMNPVSLVENHPACRKNREGQKVLPNGQTWRPQLLLLCYSLKILSEASSMSKPQDAFDHRKLFGFRVRSPPLPYLLSSLLQPRAHPKLSADQGGDNVDSDIDMDDLSDSDEEEEDVYDQLPPFKPLRKSQIAKLSRDQRKAYFEEYDYRVKLLQRKQWREELKRMREMKKGKTGVEDYGEVPEDFDAENGAPAAVPVPLPDMVLPPSFDSDNPAYRYRFLEPTSQFLARPVLDTHGWDHDCGYDGVNVEHNLGIAGHFPAAVAVQVTKDKKEFNIHLDSAVSAKHGESGSSLVGFDVQTIGKQLAYIVRGESKFKNLKKNKTAAGVSVTFLGENVATGVKVEDQIVVGKRLVLVGSTGTVRSQKDAAYGANLELRLREADYPIGQDQSSFVLSLMKWRGDLAVGGNLQTQFSVGRSSKMALRVALNNKLSGQITLKTSSSDHLELALAGLIPIAVSIYRSLKPSVSENYSIY